MQPYVLVVPIDVFMLINNSPPIADGPVLCTIIKKLTAPYARNVRIIISTPAVTVAAATVNIKHNIPGKNIATTNYYGRESYYVIAGNTSWSLKTMYSLL